MHPLGKSVKMVSWNQDDLKKHNTEPPYQNMQPPEITIQRANKRDKRERREDRHTREDLSRDDLLFLLSILEGELQVGSFLHIPTNTFVLNCVSVTAAIIKKLKLKPAFYCNVCPTRPEMR